MQACTPLHLFVQTAFFFLFLQFFQSCGKTGSCAGISTQKMAAVKPVQGGGRLKGTFSGFQVFQLQRELMDTGNGLTVK